VAIGIRELTPDDAPWFSRGMHDPAVIRHAGMHALDEAEMRERISTPRAGVHERAIVDGDEPLGVVLLFAVVLHEQRAEAGFWLLPEARGRGAATRGLELVCAWGAEELGLQRYDAFSDVDNPAAHAVLERAGFSREGLMHGRHARGAERIDAVVFGRVSRPRGRRRSG
jgi:[ribosomal protein S5]-alanine N-acetyltransferase